MTRHAAGRDGALAMFDNVMVGLSDDDAALDAFALARTLVSADGELTLVRVEAGDAPREGPPAEALAALGGVPLVVVTERSAAAGLHDVALRRGADLLVVGASRRDRVHRVLGRNATASLLEDPPCAVAVAPRGYAGGARAVRLVGIGYDGSVASEEALTAARSLAAERHARLSAFEAVGPRVFARDPFDTHAEIEERLAQARERIAALGGVEAHAEYGFATKEIRRYGESVDLLVLGPHDHDADRPPGTSLAQRLAEDPPCALLVLAPPRHRLAAAEA
jgi:nucleotide-binding universal stress UspA family protein